MLLRCRCGPVRVMSQGPEKSNAQQLVAQRSDSKAITVINPGNPVGAVLDREVMVINFATEQKLVILADEVYQANVYAEGKQFHSFKKVLRELQAEDKKRYAETQLISGFHSTSKGIIGECGQRGGYMEYVGPTF
ncbi:Alanine aminotransferase 1 [Symbiodinium microadriaticum]|uniref:Alanine aminotransferase 1 n=1 Tax=Symbiodinium microadriaticum TaxID=2951 RepID=A0A1Q9EVR9_SYMMI|nr:Alanine aminotransferase 1 [Symbiodinium microadriaticum]